MGLHVVPQHGEPRSAETDVAGLFRFESTRALAPASHINAARLPWSSIHGLWSNPWSWARD